MLALSYGERCGVNSLIAKEIHTAFTDSGDAPEVYAQWEIADWLEKELRKTRLTVHRIGIDPGKYYITTREVVAKFKALSNCGDGTAILLACQAWHAPRCWRICRDSFKLNPVGGIFVDMFSPHDPQPWVQDALSWLIKETPRE